MSRLGKLPITVPSGVQVEITPGQIRVKGPKGEVVQSLPKAVTVAHEGSELHVTVKHPDASEDRAMWGLARQLVANAVKGVVEPFSQRLELSGIGFKVQLEGKDLVLNLGFSHPIRYAVPPELTAVIEKNNAIIITGASKQRVGQIAAEIRQLKKPEPYKGKGIKYADEVIRRKAGKVVKAAGAK